MSETTTNTTPEGTTALASDRAGDPIVSANLQIALDCADPHRMADFWAAVLGYTVEHDEAFIERMMAEGHATEADVARHNGTLVWRTATAMSDPHGRRNRWYFQQVDEPKAVKNRMHIDIQVGGDHRDATVERLVSLGATRLHEGQQGPHHWVTMADIEGNEFCVS